MSAVCLLVGLFCLVIINKNKGKKKEVAERGKEGRMKEERKKEREEMTMDNVENDSSESTHGQRNEEGRVCGTTAIKHTSHTCQ